MPRIFKDSINWRWHKSPINTAQVEMNCRENGWPYRYVGTVLHIFKPGKGWYKFMMMHGSQTYFRSVITERPASAVFDTPADSGTVPSFFCERCQETKRLAHMVVLAVDNIDYTVCEVCRPIAIKAAKSEGLRVEIL